MENIDTAADHKKRQGLKFFLIVLASTLLAIVLHQAQHDPLMTLGTKPRSIVVTSGLFPAVALVCLALAFGIMGLMFLGRQHTLAGTRLGKGARFGAALGGMYLVGMIEAYVTYPVSWFGEFYTGLVDGSGILVMSLLLGKYMADDMAGEEIPVAAAFPAIAVVPVSFVLVRYFSYAVLQIESSYYTRPLATFLWTAGMGLWCGVMYLLIGRGTGHTKPWNQALVFGGLVFGVNWVIFNLFALLFIQLSPWDLLVRSGFDTLAVTTGVYLSAWLAAKQARPGEMERETISG